MTTANPLDQVRLLDVQALDTRLRQLEHRRTSLPEHARLAALDTDRTTLGDRLVVARATVTDIERELRKSETDVEQVRSRAERDQARLDSGQGSAKDLQAIQHELVSLARRQSELEDVELEVMERLESAQGEADGLATQMETIEAEASQVTTTRDAALAEFAAEATKVTAERDGIASGLDAALVALYDKIRASSGGVAAAALKAKRCEGCRMELTASDLGRIRTAPDDEVLRCDECRCILVRTAESGL